jgi:flagellar protein FlgJ
MDAAAAQRLAASPDPHGLAGLMQHSADPAVSKAVAQQFGALFMQSLMQQSDGAGIPVAGGTGGGVINNMFADTMGKAAMSGEKRGLADLLLRSIEAKQRAAGDAAADTAKPKEAAPTTATSTPAAPASGFPLTAYWQANGLRPLGSGGGHLRVPAPAPLPSSGMPIVQASLPPAAMASSAQQTGRGVGAPISLVEGLAPAGRGASSQQVTAFTQQLGPLLQQAGAQLGVSPRILLAQAAIETGWGRSVVGNNIFGIKAGSSWTGATVTTPTHEYENGKYVQINGAFRSYPTLDAAVHDFVSLVSNSSRYKAALGAGEDSGAYARALIAGGWATDIDYVQKLQSVAEGPSASAAFAASVPSPLATASP